jgi:hypothetical protein
VKVNICNSHNTIDLSSKLQRTITNVKSLDQGRDEGSKSLNRYIKSMRVMNSNTANEYKFRLTHFEKFVYSQYNNSTIDNLITDIIQSTSDPYEILSDYCISLQEIDLHSSSLKNRVTTVKNFLEFNDVEISPRKFKLKVKFPKNIRAYPKSSLQFLSIWYNRFIRQS